MKKHSSYPVPVYVDPADDGRPLFFCEGPFRGKLVRAAAAEIQKADAGRKYLRFFQVHGVAGAAKTGMETEITDYRQARSCDDVSRPRSGQDLRGADGWARLFDL
ncbi:hypothetical protein C8Q80DRAFT_1180577 [Daedaleopsis nitida]|nr:hypothetical protein C8Q80DRAFT_1180577 [Daedaleopsis nitida]